MIRLLPTILCIAALTLSPAIASSQSEPPFRGFEIPTDLVSSAESIFENRVFYTGSLNYFFKSGGFGFLTMGGYDSTDNGGTISSVTACFYNESSFGRTFKAEMYVTQFGRTVQSIPFSRSFPAQTSTCHTLSGFNAVVYPGEFNVAVGYDRSDSDNFWLGLSVTTEGNTYDVEVGSQRPPSVTGPQGPLTVKGAGLKYRIEINDSPPEDPEVENPLCAGPGWRILDDGTYENAHLVGVPDGGAMLMGDVSGETRLRSACFCFEGDNPSATELTFDAMVWDSNGPSGSPGTLLGKVPAVAKGFRPGETRTRRVKVNLEPLGIVATRPYYIGYQTSMIAGIYSCIDESESTGLAKAYGRATLSAPDEPPSVRLGAYSFLAAHFLNFKAFGIRSLVEVADESTCTPSATSLCLGNGRFRVTATFEDATRQDDAMARAFPDIDDSGLFWFYSAGNLEMLVKILNGCPINDRFWVYFAATTDVGFELTIEDLEAGTTKIYTNDFGNRADAVTDTDAFATCSF